MKRKIGIIICGLSQNRQFVTDSYIHAVHRAGGIPVILPMVKSNEAIKCYVSLFDGFLFCGGGDINPLLFKEEPAFGIGETDITLDIFQIRLMKEVLRNKKPVLAICRGMQVLNVACQGTIYQDISLKPGDAINHMQTSLTRRDVSHKVLVSPDSRLYRIIGSFAYTNSYHHQTVARPGEGLAVSARTSDGTIEALEMPGSTFVIGVQWHPESMYDSSAQMKDLFTAFIRKCC